jgi:hypothetical protein
VPSAAQAPARQVLMALANALIAPTELELREERLAKEAAAAELYAFALARPRMCQ